MIRINFLILLSLLFIGCTSSEPINDDIRKDYQAIDSQPISELLAQSLAEASALRTRLFGESHSTRSGEILNIQPIVYPDTRSQSDTAYYIVNYGDNEGYAVLSTQESMDKVWAISDEGNLHISDTVNNKGLAIFFENLFAESIAVKSSVQPTDTTIHDFQPMIRNEGTEKIGPLLHRSVRKWHQDYPYNTGCPNYFTATSPKVGCMVLSATQIMSYYECPAQLEDIQINWDEIKNNSYISQKLPQIFNTLGLPKYFNQTYLDTLTYGFEIGPNDLTNNIINVFQKIGYQKLNTSKKFSEAIATSDLKNYGPLLMHSSVAPSELASKHFWVIDGFINDYYEEYVFSNDGTPQWIKRNSYLFHCIWGEKKNGDGYYRWHTTYIGGDEREKWEPFEDRTGPGLKQYWVRYYTGFRKAQ